VPLWRPFDLDAAPHACFVPSGLVPGDEASGRALRSHRCCGGVGLDCTFLFSFRGPSC
jgi:hypothetical protein